MKFIRSKSLKQVLQFAKPYKNRFNWVIAWAVFLSVFAAVRPYFFQEIISFYFFTFLGTIIEIGSHIPPVACSL